MEETNRNNVRLNGRKAGHSGMFGPIAYFLIGGGIGAAVALLFAPKSGSEFRGEIVDVTRKGYDLALEKADELKAKSADAFEFAKEKAVNAYDIAFAKLSAEGEIVSDMVTKTAGTISDGIDRMQNESGNLGKGHGDGQKASNIV